MPVLPSTPPSRPSAALTAREPATAAQPPNPPPVSWQTLTRAVKELYASFMAICSTNFSFTVHGKGDDRLAGLREELITDNDPTNG